MLSIWFNAPKEKLYGHPNAFFPYIFEAEWFDDPFVREIVQGIDGGEVKSAYSIKVAPYGVINCNMLSATCRNTILAYEVPDIIIDGAYCGDKAGEWLLRIGEMKDITIGLSYPLCFPDNIKARIVNDGRVVDTWRKYAVAANVFLYGGIDE